MAGTKRHTATAGRAQGGSARPSSPRSRGTGRLALLLGVFALLARLARSGSSPAAEAAPEDRGSAGVFDLERIDEGPRAARAGYVEVSRRRRSRRRRFAGTLVFATLFFAGAALSAVAGDAVSSLAGSGQAPPTGCPETAAAPAEEGTGDAIPPDGEECPGTTTEEEEKAEAEPEQPQDPGAAPEPQPEPEPQPQPQPQPTPPAAPQAPTAPAAGGGATPPAAPKPPKADGSSGASAPGQHGHRHSDSDPALVDEPRPSGAPKRLDPEGSSARATVWLHRTLPDPTPRAKRLAPAFARELKQISRRHDVDWALVLAVVRAEGGRGRVPTSAEELRRVAKQLAQHEAALERPRPWLVALAYSGRTAFADRTVALARYNRAVGLRGLVRGLRASKPRLIKDVLRDERISIYGGGRADIHAGRVDVRVLVLLRYLRIAHRSVTVTSLISGHSLYTRSGNISAHSYGLAVDIAALGGVSITGNQGEGGITERAVRNILLLPRELEPQQVISLLGLGGPSFPMADHHDHIHVGY